LFLYAGGILSVIHDVDLGELFGVGKLTHTLCQSSLLSRLRPNPAQLSNPQAHVFQSLLRVFVGLSFSQEKGIVVA